MLLESGYERPINSTFQALIEQQDYHFHMQEIADEISDLICDLEKLTT